MRMEMMEGIKRVEDLLALVYKLDEEIHVVDLGD